MSSKFLVAAAALAAAVSAHATVTVASASSTYAQNFDSLASTGSATWAQDTTLAGWSLFATGSFTTYAANTGSSTTAGFYSFGSTGSTERALGSVVSNTFSGPALPSGTGANVLAVALTNGTGASLDSFTLSYTGEQWRSNGNTSAQTLTVSYGFGASYASVATWQTTGSTFTFTSPQVGSSQVVLDGNAAANRATGLGGTVATEWANGDTLWIRWVDVNDSGNDHFLAIDDVNLSFTAPTAAVPEPGTYAMLLAGLGAVGFIARRRRA